MRPDLERVLRDDLPPRVDLRFGTATRTVRSPPRLPHRCLRVRRPGPARHVAVHRCPDPVLPLDARAAVRAAFGGLGWVVPMALDRCPRPEEIYYDLVAQVELPRWSRGRVVLVGDACYAVSLLAGQGASLGVAGAFLLADRLAGARSVDAALVSYERLWRPVAEEKQRAGRAGARWFLPTTPGQLRIRRAALRMARLPLFDRIVAGILGRAASAGPAAETTRTPRGDFAERRASS
jgi:2-polyprenyl-6-methoxyphenol hydroxylase-like FAD-dependent oxidoreductase